ncbi:MAG: hypothetical protein HYW81_02445, partial [Parcubacteria group bacterium]|nr:hypothetical protein [Parcubacteria group bacterium]
MQDSSLWEDRERAGRLTRELASLRGELAQWEGLERDVTSTLELAGELEREGDAELEAGIVKKANELAA